MCFFFFLYSFYHIFKISVNVSICFYCFLFLHFRFVFLLYAYMYILYFPFLLVSGFWHWGFVWISLASGSRSSLAVVETEQAELVIAVLNCSVSSCYYNYVILCNFMFSFPGFCYVWSKWISGATNLELWNKASLLASCGSATCKHISFHRMQAL